MSNRSSQTVVLYGQQEKIQEVIDYLKNTSTLVKHEYGQYYDSPDFKISAINGIKEDRFFLETRYAPASIKEFSLKFPEVGFHTNSFTDGGGEEEEMYVINGIIIYVQYLDVQGPEYWEKMTGQKLVHNQFPKWERLF